MLCLALLRLTLLRLALLCLALLRLALLRLALLRLALLRWPCSVSRRFCASAYSASKFTGASMNGGKFPFTVNWSMVSRAYGNSTLGQATASACRRIASSMPAIRKIPACCSSTMSSVRSSSLASTVSVRTTSKRVSSRWLARVARSISTCGCLPDPNTPGASGDSKDRSRR